MEAIKIYLRALKRVTTAALFLTVGALIIIVVNSILHFPYDVDAPLSQQQVEAARKYYMEAYQKPVTEKQVESEYETKYIRVAEIEAKRFHIEEQVDAFVKRFNLSDRSVLEIGSGRGYLQDIVQRYTGLDISPSVARFYHKEFVLGSATAMPAGCTRCGA